MKKTTQKLQLNRETLTALTQREMGLAVGGGTHETVCSCKSEDGTWLAL